MSRLEILALCQQPDYLTAKQKLQDINAELARTEERIAAIEAQLAMPGAMARGDALAISERILANADVPFGRAQSDSMQSERLALRERREILAAGARLQAHELAVLTTRLSVTASKLVLARHKALALKAAEKLREMDAVQDEEHALLRELEALGYEPVCTLERVTSPQWGTLRSLPVESMLSMRIKELEAYGGKPVRAPAPQPQQLIRAASSISSESARSSARA